MKHIKILGKGLSLIFDLVIDHNVSISKYNPLAGSRNLKLPKILDHLTKGLINAENIDENVSFKWCLVRYIHAADHHSRGTTKADKDFVKNLVFKEKKLPVKVRDINQIKKNHQH